MRRWWLSLLLLACVASARRRHDDGRRRRRPDIRARRNRRHLRKTQRQQDSRRVRFFQQLRASDSPGSACRPVPGGRRGGHLPAGGAGFSAAAAGAAGPRRQRGAGGPFRAQRLGARWRRLLPTVLGYYLLLGFGNASPLGQIYHLLTERALVFTSDGLLAASLILNPPVAVQPMQRAFAAIPREVGEARGFPGNRAGRPFCASNHRSPGRGSRPHWRLPSPTRSASSWSC